MSLNDKPLEDVEEKDLQELVENEVPESKIVDYKLTLPGSSDLDKREFLRDVSSFANASGGHLIYGIKEEMGVPVEIRGLRDINPDKEILRLESIIQSGITPRVPGLSIRAVPLETKPGVVILIRILRSWASPHMVAKGSSKFFSRNSAGKYPLDVFEIRTAFLLSETVPERIRNFRAERLAGIVSGETPGPLNQAPKIVFQIIPFGAFESGARFDLSSLVKRYKNAKGSLPLPLTGLFTNCRYNFDGLLVYDSRGSYVQVFVNGIVEAVDSFVLSDKGGKQVSRGEKTIPSVRYEEVLLEALPRYTVMQEELGVEPPFFIVLSMLGVRSYYMYVDTPQYVGHKDVQIDRDALLVPEILVESFEYQPDEVMRPAFDSIWRAAGWERSMNYDEEGRWIGGR